mgnify:CR=1 FL=1
MTRTSVQKLVFSALFLAMGLLLPFLTGQIPEIGSRLSPMHLPVLLCGYVCGGAWGAVVGAVTPLLRSLLFTMPPMLSALAMAFELAAYGLVAGLLYKWLPKKAPFVYVSLVGAMLIGRIVWGVASFFVYRFGMGKVFTWELFAAGAFVNAVPAIILQLVLVPVVVLALQKARLVPIGEACGRAVG